MKGIDLAIRKAAIDLNLPEDQSKKVVMEYWETIYFSLLEGKETAVTIRHLGTFAMSRYKLNFLIRQLIKKIRATKGSKKLTEAKKEECVRNYSRKLRQALETRNKIAIEYAENFGNI
jgi:nucleoid DNA-binding protein